MLCRLCSLILLFLLAAGSLANNSPRLRAYRLPAPKVLWISRTISMAAYYLAAACRWKLTMVQTRTDMDLNYHAIDKAVEYTPEMESALQKRLTENLQQRLAEIGDYQVVVIEAKPEDLSAEQQRRLKEWVQSGGVLIVGHGWCDPGEEKMAEASPLLELMPCRQKAVAGPWFISFGRPVRDPLVAGVPTHRLHARTWINQVAPKPEAKSLTEPANLGPGYENTGFGWWVRSFGKGRVLFNQVGIAFGASFQTNLLPSHWTEKNGRFFFNPSYDSIVRYQDDGALIADLWRQIVYWLVYGRKAFPALIYLRTPDAAQDAGATVQAQISLDLADSSAESMLVAKLVSPAGEVIAEWKQAGFPGSADMTASFPIPADYCWPLAEVRAALVDSKSGDILHKATDFLEVTPACEMTATPDKFNYKPGEPVTISVVVNATKALENPMVRLTVHDFRGRVFAVGQAPLILTASAEKGNGLRGTITLTWRFPTEGCGSDQFVFFGDIQLLSAGKTWARTRVNLYDAQEWDMRKQFVYSPWNFLLHQLHPVVQRGFELERDVGYNGISGHDMGDQVIAWAERNGWRMYAEGLPGPNIWNPLIDLDGRERLRERARSQLADWVKKKQPHPFRSSAIALVSLGEEPGFKNGWGTRYYWDTPHAPAEAAGVFQSYLKGLYHDDLAALNHEWATNYASWSDVPLSKEYSQGLSEQVIQRWQQTATEKTDGEFLFHLAPYLETSRFYDWYFNEIDQAAVQVTKEALQPVWKTMFTAGLFEVATDVPVFNVLGPFYPKEAGLFAHALWVADHGDTPGFTASMWDFFDHLPLLSAELWSAAAVGNTYFDSWVDFGLCMNKDFTHTRSSMFKKRWLAAMRPISKVILDKRYYSDPSIGFYADGMVWNPSSSWNALHQQFSALRESGFHPTIVKPAQFARCKVIIAPCNQIISPEAAEALRSFVREGGTLITTMFFASFSPHGNPLTTAPALGLDDLLGFQVDVRKRVNKAESLTMGAEGAPAPAGVSLLTQRHDTLTRCSPEVKVLAKFADGAPALLSHPFGKGLVYYLNFHYDWTQWWNTFYTPDREAYRLLLERLILATPGISRPYFVRCVGGRPANTSGWWKVEFNKEAMGKSNPYWAEELYTDPSGRARYLFLFADHRAPIIDAHVEWFRPGDICYDVLTHKKLPWEKTGEGTLCIPLTLPPGGGALLAFLPSTPVEVTVRGPSHFTAGAAVNLTVAVKESRPSAGTAHSMNLRVISPDGKQIAGLAREITVYGETSVPLLTALTDPPGNWRIEVSDCVTGLRGSAVIRCLPPKSIVHSVLPERWESEEWQPPDLSAEDFIAMLDRLTQTYLNSDDRCKLGYFYFIPGETDSRHNLMATLAQMDWRSLTNELAGHLRGGATLILTGEDMGIDPRSGLSVSPFVDSHLLEALANVLLKANSVTELEALPRVLVGMYGNGRLILDRTSIDAQGWTNEQIRPWHEKWVADLKTYALHGQPVGKPFTPSVAALQGWLLAEREEKFWLPTP